MKTVGLIAEFNPFHKGHNYIIEEAKRVTGADYLVVIMSGSFVQRGMPSCMHKNGRIKSALSSGADLILELPVSYSTATAEIFAYGGISILNSLNCIDSIVFGSESGDITVLKECADLLLNLSDEKKDIIVSELSKGLSYPAARAIALSEYTDLLSSSNNILAIEYLKALSRINSPITPYTIKRLGSDYHDKATSEAYASAEGIRSLLESDTLDKKIMNLVPLSTWEIMQSDYKKTWPIDYSDYDLLFNNALISNSTDSLSSYQDMNLDIANRFKKSMSSYTSIDSFISCQKTKEITYSRLSRCILHIILELCDMTLDNNGSKPCPYTRMLGFKESASELVHTISKESEIPIITKAADAKKILDENALDMFNATIKADRIYNMVIKHKYNETVTDPMLQGPIIEKLKKEVSI